MNKFAKKSKGLELNSGDQDKPSIFSRRTFSSLKNPVFRLYYGALLCHRASMNMQIVARALLVYRLTGSAAILGAVFMANALPMLFLSLFGGVIADRVHKKYVLLIGQVGSAVVALGIALSLSLGYLSHERSGSWWILMVASLLQGAIMGLMVPSRQAIIPEIVDKEQIMNAVALNAMGLNFFRLMAPAAAGFLIDAIGFKAVYYTMAGIYLPAVVLISFMPLTGTIRIGGGGALASIKEGFRYVFRETTVLLILVFVLFIVLLSRPYMMMMPIFADDILKVGASGMGVLLSVSGIGAMVGSFALATLFNKKRGLMLLISGLILGLSLIGFSFSKSWYLSLAFISIVGVGHAARMTLGNTLLMYYTEDKYRGRVMSFYEMDHGLTSLGTFGAGLLAEAIGAPWALGSFAIILVLLSVLALAFVPRVRNLE
ncbi:MAG: MFS transporter [Candidatus Brocadiia bacterium]|nr:MAG: MFS transporter [Candidatus Brocadiia bacterium]